MERRPPHGGCVAAGLRTGWRSGGNRRREALLGRMKNVPPIALPKAVGVARFVAARWVGRPGHDRGAAAEAGPRTTA